MEKLLGVAFALLLLMLVGLTLFLMLGILPFLWDEHRGLLIAVACSGAVVATIMRLRRAGPQAAEGSQPPAKIHPGISMHALPISGGIGLVFTIGYVVMFWFGAPPYRPIVLGAAALGGLLGVVLIWLRRRGRNRGITSILHLASEREARPEGVDESQKGPHNNALHLTRERARNGTAIPCRSPVLGTSGFI
jgi:hypothetical protein